MRIGILNVNRVIMEERNIWFGYMDVLQLFGGGIIFLKDLLCNASLLSISEVCDMFTSYVPCVYSSLLCGFN